MRKPVVHLRFLFFTSLFVLVTLSLLSYQRIRDLILYSGEVERTYRALSKTDGVLSLLKDAETGQRGFMLTHSRNFLEPYYESLSLIRRYYDSLRRLTADNPRQQLRMDTLNGLMARRLEIMGRAVLYDTSRLGTRAERDTMLQRGRVTMDSIRGLFNRMRNEELRLLNERNAYKTATARMTPTYLLTLAAITLILLSGSFLFLNRELRQRLEVQKELEQKIEALNRSNAELEQFAYVASHDLQEPLRKIRAFGSKLVMRHAEGLSQEGHTLVEKIEHSAARMQRLIDDLLSFSRLVRPTDRPVSTDLNQIVQEVLSDLTEAIQTRQATIELTPLPTLEAQPTQLRQLFQNLFSNALKFSRTDLTPVIRVTTQLVKGTQVPQALGRRRELSYHRITVSDNGIGFEPQYAEKIFVIFQRLHGRFEYTGTGIGLAVCKRVVANHQGFIEAQSTPGEGATFIIYLPATPVLQPEEVG